MTARRLSERELDAIVRQRAATGRGHRALPLDVVEAKARAARVAWPNVCGSCNAGTHGDCDCMPAPGSDAPEFLADPPRPAPPAYPWRALGAGLLVVFAALGGAHAFGAFNAAPSQVAAR